MSAHDALVKLVFGHPARVAELLRSCLPAPLVAAVDWQGLERVGGSFVSPALRERHTDLLFRTRLSGRPLLLYVLVEHRSTGKDRRLPLTLLGYAVRVWEEQCGELGPEEPLPLVLPVVLAHTEDGWLSPLDLGDLFGLGEQEREAFGGLVPRFRYLLDEVTEQRAEEMAARRVGPVARVTLTLLARARRDDVVEVLWSLREDLGRVLGEEEEGLRLLSAMLEYVVQVADADWEKLAELTRELGPEVEAMRMTTAERLRQEGWQKGRQEGQQEGWQKGRQEGQQEGWQKGRQEGQQEGWQKGRREEARRLLLKLLRRRFGELPRATLLRVEEATLEELDGWAERVVSAKSLEGVLDGVE